MRAELAHLSEPFSSILEEIASELELRPLLTSIITRACGLLGADDGTIGLYVPQRHVVQIEAVHRLPEIELGLGVRARTKGSSVACSPPASRSSSTTTAISSASRCLSTPTTR